MMPIHHEKLIEKRAEEGMGGGSRGSILLTNVGMILETEE